MELVKVAKGKQQTCHPGEDVNSRGIDTKNSNSVRIE
jgi:hypothetical protein